MLDLENTVDDLRSKIQYLEETAEDLDSRVAEVERAASRSQRDVRG